MTLSENYSFHRLFFFREQRKKLYTLEEVGTRISRLLLIVDMHFQGKKKQNQGILGIL
jgi:hypothetical protein